MDPAFEVHMLNDRGKDKALQIATDFDGLLSRLTIYCGVSNRELSIVKTKLEEACFFAKKAMANQKDNQQ